MTAPVEPQARLDIEVTPQGFVLLLISSDETPTPAAFGFSPDDARGIARALRKAADDAGVAYRLSRVSLT